jgi:hypothetical protein
MPSSLPISVSNVGAYYDDGYKGANQDQTDRALAAVIARNLPSPYDPQIAAATLKGLVDDPRVDGFPEGVTSDPDAARMVHHLHAGIARNAAGNAVGIPEDTAETYELGPGDVKTHAALRDANVLASLLGRPMPPNVQAVRDGQLFGSYKSVNTPADNLDAAARYWHKGEADPTHWANGVEAYYPQNAWIGQGELGNVQENNGGSGWGNAVAWLNRWQNGGDRAIREPGERFMLPVPENARTEHVFQPLVDGAVNAAKLVGGWWKGAEDEKTHQELKGYVNRPSPLLPKGMTPGSPQANYHLKEMTGLRDDTVMPKSQDYAASQGRELSHVGKAVADNKLAWADPMTAVSGGLGATRAVIGKTAGAAVKAAATAAKAEGISEGISPFNYFGALGSLIDDPRSSMTPSQYRANNDKAQQAFIDSEPVLQRYGR